MNRLIVIAALGLNLSGSLSAAQVDYLRDIKPVLRERCYACHGALKQRAGLRLDTAALIVEGAKSGAVVVAHQPGGSVLLSRLRTADLDERMPPEGEPLSPEEIQAIEVWIKMGLPLPDSELAEEDPSDHWAFQAPVQPSIPVGRDGSNAGRNPIDALIQSEQQARGISALPSATEEILLRRVYLDLVGLPPQRDEQEAFLEAKHLDAYERLVDRLLASPQYGERWGRHWMDIWRYTDWYGLGAQLRFSQKHIWRWRDWILDSLNSDKGYDRMIEEMIAGDELAPTDPDVVRATGFLARNYYLFNRNTWLEQTIEHTSQAFLGLTMQCAKCHDHKYDPISQVDYYQFRAFFEPHQIRLDPVPGVTDLEKDGLPRAFDAHKDAPTYLFVRGNDKTPDKSRALTPQVPAILRWQSPEIQSKALPAEAHYPGLQRFVLRDHLDIAEQEIRKAERHLESLQGESTPAESENPELSAKAMEAARLGLDAARLHPGVLRSVHRVERVRHGLETSDQWEDELSGAVERDQSYQLARARAQVAQRDWELAKADDKKKKAAEKNLTSAQTALDKLEERIEKGAWELGVLRPSRKALESPAETEESRRKPYESSTTGRRTALARWMVDERNPLTARVAVNHIWLRHFGQPLVADVKDFGRRSEPPPMLALLDYLACYLMAHDWQMKPLHRLIVTSDAYRRTSSTLRASAETLSVDPNNQFLWRRVPLRMESQLVRDTMRALADELDLRMGGVTVDPSSGEGKARRSLYFTHSRDQQHLFLSMFDDAEILACYRRTESIIPQQALALINSKLALELAERVAKRVASALEDESDSEFVRLAFRLILGVSSTEDEERLCLDMLAASQTALNDLSEAQQRQRSRRNLVQALFNHNDFITVR